ncbi:cytochrome b-c1 complex subunit 9 [Athalia rosae]|uniref:cytochrome b-c1 complex subunit 9 n=1 Tax=Athalia rosae TaxID=37344 RepID=UPI0020349C78|nr:cytochrome b-c1 complex subunit 9 [Athalia rosae]
MSGFTTTLYNVVCRRTSTFALVIIGGTFVFERGYDVVTRSIFDSINRGKQWKDIKHKYEE